MTTAVEVAERGHQLAAWVNFNGTLAMTVGSSYGPDAPPADYSSPNPIRAAYNVDYIIDRGTGDYEIHFENEMPDAKYCFLGTTSDSITDGRIITAKEDSVLSSSLRFRIKTDSNFATDESYVCISIIR